MKRYNTIIPNDVVNGEGVCVSFFTQGCPHHCPGCFNEETWDFDGGIEYVEHTKWQIIEYIGANGFYRNFSVLGGEPLVDENLEITEEVISAVRTAYPYIKIFLWTGYTFEELEQSPHSQIKHILSMIDVLIDGPFKVEEKDLDLPLRGSRNQRVIDVQESIRTGKIVPYNQF